MDTEKLTYPDIQERNVSWDFSKNSAENDLENLDRVISDL
jgi:hypothetical protein